MPVTLTNEEFQAFQGWHASMGMLINQHQKQYTGTQAGSTSYGAGGSKKRSPRSKKGGPSQAGNKAPLTGDLGQGTQAANITRGSKRSVKKKPAQSTTTQ